MANAEQADHLLAACLQGGFFCVICHMPVSQRWKMQNCCSNGSLKNDTRNVAVVQSTVLTTQAGYLCTLQSPLPRGLLAPFLELADGLGCCHPLQTRLGCCHPLQTRWWAWSDACVRHCCGVQHRPTQTWWMCVLEFMVTRLDVLLARVAWLFGCILQLQQSMRQWMGSGFHGHQAECAFGKGGVAFWLHFAGARQQEAVDALDSDTSLAHIL
jgi:hypothetical protein